MDFRKQLTAVPSNKAALVLAIALTMGGLFATGAATAAGLFNSNNQQAEFLPAEKAFFVDASADSVDRIRVRFDIEPGHYLYRKRFTFNSDDAQLGEPIIPAGEKMHDEYFGAVEVYRTSLDVLLPVIGRDAASASKLLAIDIGYQGCADRGLCYPPQTRRINVSFDASLSTDRALSVAGTAAANRTLALPIPEQNRLANVIADGKLHWIAGTFFVLGVLLAFTPCVLPMVPILTSVIAGQGRPMNAMRGLMLSSTYVFAMAIAYTLFGVVAGLFGQNLQAILQAPSVLIAFSAVFVVLALSMFDLFHIQLPAGLQNRIHQISVKVGGGSLAGVAALGFLSALIVGPCLAPPLAGALLYIGRSGDAVLGGTALFFMALGMGMPLIAVGTLEASLLPKLGEWMTTVKHLFGFIMLAIAVWLLERVVPMAASLMLWSVLFAGTAVWLLKRQAGLHTTLRHVGITVSIAGAIIMSVGALTGGKSPLRPLSGLLDNSGLSGAHAELGWRAVKSIADLDRALAAAADRGDFVMLDFYADWCVSCRVMENQVFLHDSVRPNLQAMTLLRADVTDNDATDQALLRHLNVIGPPTMIFYGPDQNERSAYRLVGELNAADFAQHVSAATAR